MQVLGTVVINTRVIAPLSRGDYARMFAHTGLLCVIIATLYLLHPRAFNQIPARRDDTAHPLACDEAVKITRLPQRIGMESLYTVRRTLCARLQQKSRLFQAAFDLCFSARAKNNFTRIVFEHSAIGLFLVDGG